MYASYGYRSGVNETMRRHLAGIAREVQDRLTTQLGGHTVVDVGANDGTLLLAYEGDIERVGFEPSDVRPLGPHNIEYIGDYFCREQAESFDDYHTVDALTSIAMFYDLEDPGEFIRCVDLVLGDNGLWVLELSYLPTMLEMNSFDTICHEHVAYYSLSTLEPLLAKRGFVVIDATINDINGGSIRVTAAKRGSVRAQSVSAEARARLYALRRSEFEMRLDTAQPFDAFAQRVIEVRDELQHMLRSFRDLGLSVVGYGASTKGNVILQYCGVDKTMLAAIADRNPAKVGGVTVGTGIPIISEEQMRAAKPDYLLALPWHFMPEFLERERELIAGGTKFIVPLPTPRVLL
jgi:NDP-4-keto-2,6-dideoxyhexose 3-C-methyltransferase